MKVLVFVQYKSDFNTSAFKNLDWSFLSSLLKVKWASPGRVHYLGTRHIFTVILIHLNLSISSSIE